MLKKIIKIIMFLVWLGLAYYLTWKFYLRLRTISVIAYILLYYFFIRNNKTYKYIIDSFKLKINEFFKKKD